MSKRQHKRFRKRAAVDVMVEAQRFRAFVTDVSVTGLFLQTPKKIPAGKLIEVTFPPTMFVADTSVKAKVVRRREVPRHLSTSSSAGVGLLILEAPIEYLELIDPEASRGRYGTYRPQEESFEVHQPGSAKPAIEAPLRENEVEVLVDPKPEEASGVLTEYRVRVAQLGGPRSRYVTVDASGEEDAKFRALAKVGEGWEVLSVESR